ncbi:hypothetical protein QYM36_016188 [Artemia franciscana]|uniref:Uncharacterized protein n=1 Tax=Artemia franciscana TaxID=6661 RepID=A0AA88L363_ARTSF|nr:hypothetical protein QYM36_016188 [Artemia franciscana]
MVLLGGTVVLLEWMDTLLGRMVALVEIVVSFEDHHNSLDIGQMGGRHMAKKERNNALLKWDQDHGPNCNWPDITLEETNVPKRDYAAEKLSLDKAA